MCPTTIALVWHAKLQQVKSIYTYCECIAEKYSPKEMQEAQETCLYHLSKASEFRVDEREIVHFCKVRPM